MVDLADAAFLGADAAGEIAEMVDRERQVGGHGLADRLAIVPCLAGGEHFEIFFHAVSDPVEDQCALSNRGLAPGIFRGMGGVEGEFDVGGIRPRNGADVLARDGRRIVEIAPGLRGDELAADEIVVPLLERGRQCR